jgi:tetratricopeptide (TPR) repeat protein
MGNYKNYGVILAVLAILLFASACPKPTGGNAVPEGRSMRFGAQAKAVTPADIDVAGVEDKELAEVAGKVLDKRGAFVAADKLSKEEWAALKAKAAAKQPAPFAYYLLAGIENSTAAGSAEAIAAAQKAAGLSPKSAWAQDLLGHVLSSGGRDDEALSAFNKARTLSAKGVTPPYSSSKGGRDDEVMKGGRDDEVQSSGGRDDELKGSSANSELGSNGPLRYANHAPAADLVKKAGGEPPKAETLGLPGFDDAELASLEALLLNAQGYFYRNTATTEADWKAMMDKLRTKADEGKSALASWLYAGALLVEKDTVESPQLKDALAQAQKAVDLAKDSPRAHYLLGVTQEMAGASVKAMAELKQAIKLDQLYAAPHFALAEVYLRIGDRESAKRELQAVMSMKGATSVEKASAEAKLKAIAQEGN